MQKLYSNIKEKRLELGLTQEELAKKMGYADKSMIAKIEAGSIDLPQSKIEAFAKVLNTSPSWLMGWDEDDTSEKDKLLQEAFDNPDRRILFSLNEKATDQQVKVAIQFMKTLLGEEE